MPSPFPGMNPYLEQDDVWQDFHESYVPALANALSPHLSPDFIVKVDAHFYPRGTDETSATSTGCVIIEPFEEKQTYLEIRDRRNRELITVIEVLSPTNKRPGPDREQYIGKRGNLLRSKANFVEIDLLRGGPELPLQNPPACAYHVLVSRVEGRPEADYWPIQLRDRLPVIPIPVREPRPIVPLDLQEVLNTVYDRAYYKDYIYDGTPSPLLSEIDAEWAASLLKGA